MLFLVSMAILIALSDLFGDNPATVKLELDSERTPAWHAVLVAFIYPLMASFMTLLNKYANVTLQVDSTDWVYAHTLAFSIMCTVVGAFHWSIAGDFQWVLFVEGFFAGNCTLFGAVLIVKAFNVPNAPLGPTVALQNSQVMYLVIVDAFVKQTIPVWMQFIGLTIGIIGTLTLSMPDMMFNFLLCLTRCQRR